MNANLFTLISSSRPASLWTWGGGLVLSTQAHVPPLCINTTLATNGGSLKNANILTGDD